MEDTTAIDAKAKSIGPLWKRVIEALGLAAGLIGSVTAIVIAYNEVAASVSRLLEPSDLVVTLVPDLSSAQVYTRILADAGIRAKSATLEQINSLGSEAAGVVIIDGRLQAPERIAGLLKERSWAKAQLIGMGSIGSAVIREIDPDTILSYIEHEHNDPIIFGGPDVPSELTAGLPTDHPFNVYTAAPLNDDAAVYDEHSLAVLGALGIVRRTSANRFPCGGGYWPIVQQGRYVFWGYADDPENLTAEGKRLLLNLVKYLQSELARKFQTETVELRQTPPLLHSDKLDCTSATPGDEQTYPLLVNQPGTIRIQVNSKEPLSLILNGPGRVNAYARKDGTDLQVAYTVTQHEITRGTQWKATVTSFSMKPGDRIPYRISIDYPPPQERHLFIWIAIGLAGLALFGFVVIWGFKRFRGLVLQRP